MAAEAAHFQGRSDQAEQELAALAAQATSDAEKARVALLRFDNVFFERGADFQIIDDTLADIADPFWRDELTNRRLFVTAVFSGPQRRQWRWQSTWLQSSATERALGSVLRLGPHGPPRRGHRAVDPSPGYQRDPCTRRAVAPVDTVRPSLRRARLLRPSRRGGRAPHHGVSRSYGSSGGRSESFRRRCVRRSFTSSRAAR